MALHISGWSPNLLAWCTKPLMTLLFSSLHFCQFLWFIFELIMLNHILLPKPTEPISYSVCLYGSSFLLFHCPFHTYLSEELFLEKLHWKSPSSLPPFISVLSSTAALALSSSWMNHSISQLVFPKHSRRLTILESDGVHSARK